MLNRNPSAWTAAKKSSNCSLLQRPALIATILMLAAGLLVSSCNNGKKTPKTIVTKSYLSFFNQPMPNGICRYFYKEYENGESKEFQDSSNKYNIGIL